MLPVFSLVLLQYPVTSVAKDLQSVSDSASTKATTKRPGVGSAAIRGTAMVRMTDTNRAVQGKLGLRLAPGHSMHLVGQTTMYSMGSAANQFGIGYHWRIAKKYSLNFNSMNIETRSGKTRTDYGLGLRYLVPTKLFQSNIRVGYKSTQNISTLTDVNFSISKNVLPAGSAPLRISGNTRWRHKEFASGNVVEDFGGVIGLNLRLKQKIGLRVQHNIGDDISREMTILSSTYSARCSGKPVLLKASIDSRDTALFMLQTNFN